MGKKIVLLGSLLVILLAVFSFGKIGIFKGTPLDSALTPKEQTSTQQVETKNDSYTYHGKDGKSAQDLLITQEHADIKFDKSGMVVSINHRQADPEKHEFWSFYVNGKLAETGAADYITTDSDVIEWKIDTY